MVCLLEESDFVTLTVTDKTNRRHRKRTTRLGPSKLIQHILTDVGVLFKYPPDGFELILTTCNRHNEHVLNKYDGNKTLREVGIIVVNEINDALFITRLLKPTTNMSLYVSETTTCSDDDLLLGASASPTASRVAVVGEYPLELLRHADDDGGRARIVDPVKYVGLVNQAMTCYLNSLVQALYMTPEFRNALYNWEFDGQNETRSIPFQLQKLFLNLQTSPRSAVETTDLTTSFGWQGSEAWHQHDIQELCRVMFDALEHKFRDTQQANLIRNLYEGKMLDYVKCLECGTEKSREDTFLDIPLPVRPFGSTVAYGSVEEALSAFVQPETLVGNNQYFCEKCDKKCDAHKGLKFTKFPYLLTLHLKRFDFDYNTMHRIKLNDKVVFPEKLNLNSFTFNNNNNSSNHTNNVMNNGGTSCNNNDALNGDEIKDSVKCDDCSTTDSGSALDDESCQGTDVLSGINGQDDNCEDSDEGIDVSSGTNHETDAKGPYSYELFSIMIHSGSASGGHYYAYIKDFDRNQWFCFNDQNVNRITEEDIRKTYGSASQRGYYSGTFSSSINAYMLMYRQIDSERNCKAISCDEFPAHIQLLLEQMHRKEEEDRLNKEKENNMIKLNVYCIHPTLKTLQDVRISMLIDSTLAEAASYARQRFKLEHTVNLDDCRIVSYNKKLDCIDCSLSSDDIKFCDIAWVIDGHNDCFLEIKNPDSEFQVYKKGGINIKCYPINLDAEEIDEPVTIRVDCDDKVIDVKHRLSKLLNFDVNAMQIILEMYCIDPKFLDNDDAFIKFDRNCTSNKLYVCNNALEEDDNKKLANIRKIHNIIEKYKFTISLTIALPDTDLGSLEILSIPSLDLSNNIINSDERNTNSPNLIQRVSPQPGGGTNCCSGDGFGDQSNSEDSSLSDSDRTLVGDAPGEYQGLLLTDTSAPSDLHMTSPTDPAEDTYNYDVMGNPAEEMSWENEEKCEDYYFRITSVTSICENDCDGGGGGGGGEQARSCQVLVDVRTTLAQFKKHLESTVKVPAEYFKIFRNYSNSEEEWSTLTHTLKSIKDGERLIIKLGRVLSWNECNCKVYLLKPDNITAPCQELFEYIIAKGETVLQVKSGILKQMKKHGYPIINPLACRLREKSWKKPVRVYLDHEKFYDDISVPSNFELYVQELDDVEKVTSPDQLVLFVRHWCPSTLTLQPFQEIIMDGPTIEEFKTKISELSNIPVERVKIANCRAAFPCEMHVLDIHTELEWNSNATKFDEWHYQIDNGCTFFYRDKDEKLKELTADERKEFNQRENTRLGRFPAKTYSPGRERALKIYLDASPSKPEKRCID